MFGINIQDIALGKLKSHLEKEKDNGLKGYFIVLEDGELVTKKIETDMILVKKSDLENLKKMAFNNGK